MPDIDFESWLRRWSCFPAGTLVVIDMVEDPTAPNGRRYITQAIETILPGTLVLSRQEHGHLIERRPILDVFHNKASHLRVIKIRRLDGLTSKFKTTDDHPIFLRVAEKPFPANYPQGTATSEVDPWRATELARRFPQTTELANFGFIPKDGGMLQNADTGTSMGGLLDDPRLP